MFGGISEFCDLPLGQFERTTWKDVADVGHSIRLSRAARGTDRLPTTSTNSTNWDVMFGIQSRCWQRAVASVIHKLVLRLRLHI